MNNQYTVNPYFYSVSELAELLNVTTRTVRNLIQRGRFPGAHRIDPGSEKSSYRIPRKDVEAFLVSQRESV